ncbi:leucine-rich repeat-containing protein 63-like [Mytilus trossulus]|uniref:leucine-rich repeat-containing protein 63-like n=1 Tax=Mytilus trossulus TaxID=6551 RepID=UPI0030055753
MAHNGPSVLVTSSSEEIKKKKGGFKLLRKPRAPKLPPIPFPPSPDPAERPFYENYDFENEEYETYSSFQQSPPPSAVPSLISPPPSESNPRRGISQRTLHLYGSPLSHVSYIAREDRKYVLDPLYRDRTSLGTYVDGKSLVKPFKPRGPDGLPARPPKRYNEVPFIPPGDPQDEFHYYQPPAFTLESFVGECADVMKMPLPKVREAIISKHNYKKLTNLLARKHIIQNNEEMHVKEFTPEDQNIPPTEPRIPQRQLLVEMAAMIKQHVRDLMGTEVKSVIRPLKKYSPQYNDANIPHTEIILYEDEETDLTRSSFQQRQDTEVPSADTMFHSARSRYFQGSGRSQSPFTAQGDGVISPSELAILDCLINGGKILSLKAHFIAQVPDLSPLMRTVTYINLSFNDFSLFPREILGIRQLEVLKLRNNPLRELPPDINSLQNLRVLVVSFCLLSSLPLGLFSLPKLEHLDISYNKVTFIPIEIKFLTRCLRELNLEGNQLPAMPSGALGLELDYLNVKNNFMHPLFWKENTQNQPQRLIDMAALMMFNSDLHMHPEHYPESVNNVLASRSVCDCCQSALYGPGLRIIRPVSKLHGIKNLPFIFRACSPSCLQSFKSSKETLSEVLYGVKDREYEYDDEEHREHM